MKAAFLNAGWKNLIMANYAIDPALLKPYLPHHTELDVFKGKVYVSLVGFLFLNTRIRGFRIPYHVNFEEVNLRFYVTHTDADSVKRGVVFIKEIVPRAAITFVANTLYREKYCTMPMRHSLEENNDGLKLKYEWKYRGQWNAISAETAAMAVPIEAGSEAEFIAEHYYGYSSYNAATTFEYEVKHPRWNIFPVKNYAINCDFAGIYGDAFAFLKDEIPTSFFVAEGSEVSVHHKRNL